jgi:hypothetical protein
MGQLIHYGLASGKYRNPFLTVNTSKGLIIFELHTCSTSPFFFRKTVTKGLIRIVGLKLSLTIFKR